MEKAGVIDLTPSGKLEVRGRDAARLLDRLTANELPDVGQTVVTHMLTERGRVYAELTLSRLDDDVFFCITGAGSELHDLRYHSRQYQASSHPGRNRPGVVFGGLCLFVCNRVCCQQHCGKHFHNIYTQFGCTR